MQLAENYSHIIKLFVCYNYDGNILHTVANLDLLDFFDFLSQEKV